MTYLRGLREPIFQKSQKGVKNVQNVAKIFSEIQSTNSKLEKQRIIRANKDNKLFTDTLVFLLSPYVQTGLSNKKITKKVAQAWAVVSCWEGMMKYLEYNNTGKDYDIATVQNFINNQPEDMRNFYIGLVTKSCKLGCDAKIINSVIPNLIPTFDVMLGTPIEKCKIKNGEWFSISQKLNGNRAVFVNGKMMSRQGKEFTGLEHIIDDITSFLRGNIVVLDGELVGKNVEGLSDSENFQKSTGIANSKDTDKSSLKYVIFDILTLDEFQKGYSDNTYKQRRKELLQLKDDIVKRNLENIEVVPMFYEGTDQSEISKWLEYAEEHDYEGCMINLNRPYECKRVKHLQKVKAFKDIDLRCVSVNEAEIGKYKGTLGSITCSYKNGTVDVGSGFTDEQRDYYYNNPDEIVNKIVTVKYKEATTNKNGGESLQFPVFITVRFDKDVADS